MASQTDHAAIDGVRDRHIATLNAGDAPAFTELIATDGVQMPPNAPANVGAESIAGWIGGFLSLFSVEFALDVAEVQVAGDWAFERGAYRMTLHPKSGGGSVADNGKYITIYARQAGGDWKVARDIWSSDIPAR